MITNNIPVGRSEVIKKINNCDNFTVEQRKFVKMCLKEKPIQRLTAK